MGVFSNSKSRGDSPPTPTPSSNSKPPCQGRERLIHFGLQIAAAQNVIEELDQYVNQLKAILIEAEVASRDLQNFIAGDGGVVALSRYSAGHCKADEPVV